VADRLAEIERHLDGIEVILERTMRTTDRMSALGGEARPNSLGGDE
jgi:hypothetical protein